MYSKLMFSKIINTDNLILNFNKLFEKTFVRMSILRKSYELSTYKKRDTAWNVSVFGVFLVSIFPNSDWIRRDTVYLSVFSSNAGKYDQKNSKYDQFSRSKKKRKTKQAKKKQEQINSSSRKNICLRKAFKG